MGFEEKLKIRRDEILDRWRKQIFAGYERCSSLIGETIRSGTADLLDGLIEGHESAEMARRVDAIIRLRAVQDFTPSQALSFVFELKDCVRSVLGREVGEGYERFASDVDRLALTGFEMYVGCREKVLRLRADMTRDRAWKLMERAGLLWEEVGETDDKER